MQQDDPQLIKRRELLFRTLHPDPAQASSAAQLLEGTAGILGLEPLSTILLRVTYDVRLITLSAIERSLAEVGYHLDNSLFLRLKRALYYYAEETQRANLGLERGCERCVEAFVRSYELRHRGCRDKRPEHWRSYL